jgi:hypothetical protein
MRTRAVVLAVAIVLARIPRCRTPEAAGRDPKRAFEVDGRDRHPIVDFGEPAKGQDPQDGRKYRAMAR